MVATFNSQDENNSDMQEDHFKGFLSSLVNITCVERKGYKTIKTTKPLKIPGLNFRGKKKTRICYQFDHQFTLSKFA